MGFKDDSNPSEREKNGTILGSIIYKILQTYFYLFGTPVCMSHIYIIIYNYIYSICIYIYIYIGYRKEHCEPVCFWDVCELHIHPTNLVKGLQHSFHILSRWLESHLVSSGRKLFPCAIFINFPPM